jgi:hypothetical protein
VPDVLAKRLIQAMTSQDVAELERTAKRLGINGLLDALQSKQRTLQIAALEGAPLVEKSWYLLDALIDLMTSPERSLASLAAAATIAISENLRQPVLELNEEGPYTLEHLSLRLLRLAASKALSDDIRVQSLLALAQLSEIAPLPPAQLLPFLDDPLERMRETAVELFAHDASATVLQRLARLVAEDSSDSVARAAATIICAQLPMLQRKARSAESAPLQALQTTNAFSRLRQLLESPDVRRDQVLEMARCLQGSNAAENRRAYNQLLRRSPKLRRLLQQLAQ